MEKKTLWGDGFWLKLLAVVADLTTILVLFASGQSVIASALVIATVAATAFWSIWSWRKWYEGCWEEHGGYEVRSSYTRLTFHDPQGSRVTLRLEQALVAHLKDVRKIVYNNIRVVELLEPVLDLAARAPSPDGEPDHPSPPERPPAPRR